MACLSLFPCVCGKTGNISEELIEMTPSSRQSGGWGRKAEDQASMGPSLPNHSLSFYFSNHVHVLSPPGAKKKRNKKRERHAGLREQCAGAQHVKQEQPENRAPVTPFWSPSDHSRTAGLSLHF